MKKHVCKFLVTDGGLEPCSICGKESDVEIPSNLISSMQDAIDHPEKYIGKIKKWKTNGKNRNRKII